MSGMISERSANRGSCAQSCRKGYTLDDVDTSATLDSGFVISAKDLGAYDSLAAIADAGVGCLKIEGRKKKPEYVATVTRGYREFLKRVAEGGDAPVARIGDRAAGADLQPRIHTAACTRVARAAATSRAISPTIAASPLDASISVGDEIVIVEVTIPLAVGDGVAFEREGVATRGGTHHGGAPLPRARMA